MTRSQQGVVEEVVFPNGKQDGRAKVAFEAIPGYPQEGPLCNLDGLGHSPPRGRSES